MKYYLSRELNKRWYQFSKQDTDMSVMNEDWDNLIILDGARPEFLSSTPVKFDGQYDTRISSSSESWSFMQKNFVGRRHHDTVYITANPHASKLDNHTFHHINNLIESDWDEKTGTVPPDRVVQKTIEAHSAYPNKRIISHFMQPHYPFLQSSLSSLGHLKKDDKKEDPWTRLNIYGRFAEISREEVISAYRENHEVAAKAAKELTSKLDGKTIVTADHANLIGERGRPLPVRMYGHPPDLYKTELVRVPWIVCDYDGRREIRSEPPASTERRIEDEVVSDRLEALGYK